MVNDPTFFKNRLYDYSNGNQEAHMLKIAKLRRHLLLTYLRVYLIYGYYYYYGFGPLWGVSRGQDYALCSLKTVIEKTNLCVY